MLKCDNGFEGEEYTMIQKSRGEEEAGEEGKETRSEEETGAPLAGGYGDTGETKQRASLEAEKEKSG